MNRTSILLAVGAFVVVSFPLFRTTETPEATATPSSHSAKATVPATQDSGAGSVAAIAFNRRANATPRPDPDPAATPATNAPATTLVTSVPDAPPAAGPDWSALLGRHVKGDETALPELLGAVTAENAAEIWQAARGTRLSKTDRAGLYGQLGKLGGAPLVGQLFDAADPNAALAVRGWGESNLDETLDWFRQLDVKGDPKMREYLQSSHQLTQEFLDQLSGDLLDTMHPAPDTNAPEAARESYASETIQLVESLLEQDRLKGEAMMRELTERLLTVYDGGTLSDWVSQLGDPSVKSAAVQRIIEAGTFSSAPLDAVDWALSLEEPQTRGNALSAAFGRLGGGGDGVDPAEAALHLKDMPPGRDRDFAINGFVHGLVGREPDAALEWAAAISDENFRKVVTDNITVRINAKAAGTPPAQTP